MKLFKLIWNMIITFFLNKRSSKNLKWEPSWFGEDGYSKKLIDKISKFQKGYGLEETGVVDSATIRRRITEKEALLFFIKDISARESSFPSIICDMKNYEIEWNKVITYRDNNGFQLSKKNYKKYLSLRNPTMFVTHWDVCLSARSCFNILEKRGLSVHFLIDNDGTIYQIMDCNDIGWHSGNRKVNDTSIGVEISNAYYPKYQEVYRRKGFGPRPVLKNVSVHGKELKPFLGFYPVQVEAFKALAKALNKIYNIPLTVPMENDTLVETIYDKVQDATFKGVVSHYHVTKRKIDCAGLKLDEVLRK